MRAILIDDERLARVEMRRLLKIHPEIEIVGEAASIQEALKVISEVRPDLIFLDVQLSDGTGFELLEQLESVPAVIFTTAYEDYALRAFDVSALDYVMKPVAPHRLALAVSKLLRARKLAEPKHSDSITADQQRIFVRDGERCWFVQVKDIVLLESEGSYTKVFFGSVSPLILRSLNYLEEHLDSRIFFRASRSYIINLNCVRSITPALSGNLLVVMVNGMQVEMSRRQSQLFRKDRSL